MNGIWGYGRLLANTCKFPLKCVIMTERKKLRGALPRSAYVKLYSLLTLTLM
jgi:hypothetical protein